MCLTVLIEMTEMTIESLSTGSVRVTLPQSTTPVFSPSAHLWLQCATESGQGHTLRPDRPSFHGSAALPYRGRPRSPMIMPSDLHRRVRKRIMWHETSRILMFGYSDIADSC